mmetsp:Transcript_20642/g.32501  ORF Transcript_20642/g.32501 Transcript_20642/m.32501 type:complete len:337 (-) Transcript_20642:200-1210(-)|eukprot:CAMPEP_0201600190 /NCGR_PEP_ID=MMETSP0492-20130828/1356_1 /ASSEMBLY_ACC=CAM_ASM_000837 /TAXON_ID=420259 /ORGANISM="Thalassiosira gravida, Strain GMp14c1" /LENGTH=336 /DNA_ID=CAMNT_0048062907 /DNA_START=229 /DNA_END=1239 /DNA_ORIENTATION=-
MPASVYLVTGGARSGKSSYAQNLCEKTCPNPIYLATSKVWDDDFKDRVKRHQNERGDNWTTIEEPLHPSKHSDKFGSKAILVDCLTLWLTNYFMELGAFTEPDGDKDAKANENDDKIGDASEQALEKTKAEFNKMITQWDATFVFVTNEIGSGLHADNAASRKFVDAQGWLNQYVSSKADMVIHMVAGVPNIIKQFTPESRDPLKAPASHDLTERAVLDQLLSTRSLTMDDKGYFMMKLDHAKGVIRVTYHSCIKNDKGEVCDVHGKKISCCEGNNNRPEPMATFEARTAKELTVMVFERWEHAKDLVSVGHAAYIGREAQKAEECLFAGRFYQQD